MGPVSARPQFISRPVEFDTNQLDKAQFEVLISPVGVWEQAQPSRKADRKKQLSEFSQHTPASQRNNRSQPSRQTAERWISFAQATVV